ncbi:MAG: hypothetical protein QOJ03_2265, partial [Frankiaceae bacterium]|nr:hypothetical protein [Frankiaceae bacterium]
DAGIAAYAAPTPATSGGSMELRLPERPIDRLWVDDSETERARELLARETAPLPPPSPSPPPASSPAARTDADFDAAWQQVLAGLQTTTEAPLPAWPDEVGAGPADGETDLEPIDPADEAHFEPPPPPPLPKLRPVTLAALAAIAVGLLMLATNFDGGSWTFIAVVAVLGGLASLVWNMRNGPPTDSGWDDGAVV